MLAPGRSRRSPWVWQNSRTTHETHLSKDEFVWSSDVGRCGLSQSRRSTIELCRGNRFFVASQIHGSEPFQIRSFQILAARAGGSASPKRALNA